MIFIALGTQKFQMNRLLKMVDQLCESGAITETVFAQKGASDYQPKFYLSEDFLDSERFQQKIEQCDLLITHGGVATIISGLKMKKPVVVVPRLAKYGEHIDDHQVEIAEAFSQKHYLMIFNEGDTLENVIQMAREEKFEPYISHRSQVLDAVRASLASN